MDHPPTNALSLLSPSDLETLIQSVVERVLRQELPQLQRHTPPQSPPATSPQDSTPPEETVAHNARLGEAATPTHCSINPALLQEAVSISSSDAVAHLIDTVLEAYISHYKRLEIIGLFGTIDYDDNHDYKQQRSVA